MKDVRRREPVSRLRSGGRRLRVLLALAAAGCASGGTSAPPTAPSAAAAGSPTPSPVEEAPGGGLPGGLGTLRQDDITLTLRAEGVQIKVTPLEGSITRLTAPDTWTTLSGLDRVHRTPLTARTGPDVTLFLVSFFSDAAGETFRPRDLSLMASGVTWRAAAIQPVTPGWDRERLEQRETQMAIYAFPVALDFDQSFRVEYGTGAFGAASGADWDRILPVVQRERARIRTRGGEGSQRSRSNFSILR